MTVGCPRLAPNEEIVGAVADPREANGRLDAIRDSHEQPLVESGQFFLFRLLEQLV
jgi:hypothetical protein